MRLASFHVRPDILLVNKTTKLKIAKFTSYIPNRCIKVFFILTELDFHLRCMTYIFKKLHFPPKCWLMLQLTFHNNYLVFDKLYPEYLSVFKT